MMMQPGREEYEKKKELERQQRQDHFRVAAGMMEFLGVVLGVVSILVLVALLISLISWLSQNVSGTFSLIRTQLQ